MPCIALYQDSWYRARITALSDKYIQVFFVDFGNTEKVQYTEIREITDLVRSLPVQVLTTPHLHYSLL